MTTIDPGARLVLTHGFGFSPRAFAFCASRPAAIITLGFDVLVQLVIAATTTAPWSSPAPLPFAGARAPGCNVSSACVNAGAACARGTRSWGRLGPAMLGSTRPRSNSTTSA